MRISLFVMMVIWMTLSGCENKVGSQNVSKFETGKRLSELTDKKLKEASGLAASVKNPGLLWTLNDSGNEAEVYLLDKDLKINLTITLTGVDNRDWEDIVVGPGPDPAQTYIYVGDIGDNDAAYEFKYIYRFQEPKLTTQDQIAISDFDKIIFKLEGSVKDTESLFIDPGSKNLYVVSKREEPVFVYELQYPQATADTVIASKLFSLPFTEIVAADCFNKSGDILMKNYTHVYYWENKNNLDVISLLKQQPQEIPYEEEPKGESIAWAADGSGFFTLSEKTKKQPSYLYFYPKK
jgi:hypothetical protein